MRPWVPPSATRRVPAGRRPGSCFASARSSRGASVERAAQRGAAVDDHQAAIVGAAQHGGGAAVGDGLPAVRRGDAEVAAGGGVRGGLRRRALRGIVAPAACDQQHGREQQGAAERGAGERDEAGHRITT